VLCAVLAGACSASSGADRPGDALPARRTTAPSTGPTATQASGDVCATTPTRRPPDPDRLRYRLRVDVRPGAGMAAGDLAVTFTPDIATDRLVLRLWPNGPRLAREGAHLDADAITVDGVRAAVEAPDPTTLVVARGSAFAPGRAVDVRLNWRLRLPGPVADRISHTGDAVRLGSFFPLLAWEPGVGWATEGPTEVNAETATAPAADFDVDVTVPPGSSVLASGAEGPPGHWTATGMRDFALSVGRFTIVTGTAHVPRPVAVTVGVHAGVEAAAGPYLEKAVRVIEDFSRRFGPYPWPVYSIALTPNLAGGIEYPGHTMQGAGTLGRTTSHEVGHQWFYALVGDDQARDPWLDEGLATYAEGRFEDTLATVRVVDVPVEARGHAGEAMSFWDSRPEAYYPGVYLQPAQALVALGDVARVDCALRLYVAAAAYRIARPADLLAVVGRVFPGAAEVLAPYGLHL
jgi:hypothetical protein